jgi:hypothetical protein
MVAEIGLVDDQSFPAKYAHMYQGRYPLPTGLNPEVSEPRRDGEQWEDIGPRSISAEYARLWSSPLSFL